MEITEVNIDFINSNRGLVGFANITIDNNIYLSSIGIYKKLSDEGFRITYPKKQDRDIFYPINKKTSLLIEQAIFNKLKEVIKDVKNDRYNNFNNTNN